GRVALDALYNALVVAGAGLVDTAAVLPFRFGAPSPDPPGIYRNDTITIQYVAAGAPTPSTVTYWLKSDDRTAAYQLMSCAGGASPDGPVVDHVVAVAFASLADAQPPLAPGDLVALTPMQLVDGPWLPDPASPSRWDADLLRVRAIRVTLRVESANAALRGPAGALFFHGGTGAAPRWAPDLTVSFRVAPRNLNRSR